MADALPLGNGIQGPGRAQPVRVHEHFVIRGLDVLDTAVEHDSAAVDIHHVGEDVLDLLDLMCRHDHRAASLKVVLEQRIVELFAIEQIESQRRLVEHQQLCIDRHHDGEVQLRHHPLRQFPDPDRRPDRCLRQKRLCLRPVELGMDRRDEIERLGHPQPARQHRHVGDEADVADQSVPLPPWIPSEDAEFSLIGGEADDRVQRGGLAGAVGTDQANDAPFVHA